MQENGTIADHHIRSTGWSCDLGQEDCQKRDRRKVIWNAHTVFIKIKFTRRQKKEEKKKNGTIHIHTGDAFFASSYVELPKEKSAQGALYSYELFFRFVFSFLLTRPRTKRRNTVNGIGQLFFFVHVNLSELNLSERDIATQ